jgi:hypothetical protein
VHLPRLRANEADVNEKPYFPSPADATPYRARTAPEVVATPSPTERPSARVRAAEPPPVAPTRRLIEAVVAERAHEKRAAWIAIAVGVVLIASGVVLTFVASGYLVFYGAVVAGVISLVKGSTALAKAAIGEPR